MKQDVKEKGFTVAGAAIAVAVIAALAFGGWYVWQKNSDNKQTSNSNNTNQNGQNQQKQEEKKTSASKAFNCQDTFTVMYPESLQATVTSSQQCLISNVSVDQMPPVGPLPPEQLGLFFSTSATEFSTGGSYLEDYIARSQEDAALELRSQQEISLDNGGTATLATVYGGHPSPHEFYFFVHVKEGTAITTSYSTNSNHKDVALKILKSIR